MSAVCGHDHSPGALNLLGWQKIGTHLQRLPPCAVVPAVQQEPCDHCTFDWLTDDFMKFLSLQVYLHTLKKETLYVVRAQVELTKPKLGSSQWTNINKALISSIHIPSCWVLAGCLSWRQRLAHEARLHDLLPGGTWASHFTSLCPSFFMWNER